MPSAPPPAAPDSDRPLHVKLVKGRWYWDPPDRLRKSHGLVTKPLGADQANAWAYARTLNRDHLGLGPGAPVVGSVAWVFASYMAGDRYLKLAASTRKDYRWLALAVLAPLPVGRRTLGELQALSIKPRHADTVFADLLAAKGHHTAHYACRFARRVWHWAARREMVDDLNPWAGMELPGLPARTALWQTDQVAAVVAQAHAAGRPSLALATLLAYWLSHRQADVLALTWTTLEDGRTTTQKTGANLPISAAPYPELAVALAECRRLQLAAAAATTPPSVPPAHVLIHEGTDQKYNQHTFRHEWRAIARAAGIPPALQFRDLRATALTEISDAGADAAGFRTHGGHTTPSMRLRYARPTEAQFTRAATARVEHLASRKKKAP